jgi:hypothetical protein
MPVSKAFPAENGFAAHPAHLPLPFPFFPRFFPFPYP